MNRRSWSMLLLALLLLALPLAVRADVEQEPALTLEEGEALAVQYFYGVLAEGNPGVTQRVLAPSFRHVDRSLGSQAMDLQEFRMAAAVQRNGFTHMDYTFDAVAVEGATVAVCWTAGGKLQEGFTLLQPEHITEEYIEGLYWKQLGVIVPPERMASWTGMSFLRVEQGQIVEEMVNMEAIDLVLDATAITNYGSRDAF